MPCIEVTASMENNGVSLDYEYNNQLGEKYHSLLEEQKNTVYGIIDKYRLKIDEYKLKHTNNKLSEPINIDSPKQLEILFYDILGYQQVSSKTPRGTGEDVLVAFNDELSKAILDYRGTKKLVTTYIDKLPNCVNKNDGKIHCKFNQYGTDTGRYSSQDPNMQNIPSHNRDIRKMFVASEGNVMMSSDYSQQEQLEFIDVDSWCEVETPSGFVYANNISVGDILKVQDESCVYTTITVIKVDNLVDKNQIRYYYK